MHAAINYIIMFHSDKNASDDEEGGALKKKFNPVVCSGRQPGTDIFIVGPELQFTKEGREIPVHDQDYVWVPYILKKLKKDCVISPLIMLPSLSHPLKNLVEGLKAVTEENFISSLFILG